MDNEEIRELLKELKETSDESSSVKSRVVKIHFDTRKEAEARQREKQKAREEAERKRLEEEEEKKRQQEALAREAEKKAEEIVSEAKAEASAAFSPDLGEEIERLNDQESAEEDKPEADLDLTWDPGKMPRLRRYFRKKDQQMQTSEEDEKTDGEASGDQRDLEDQPGQEEKNVASRLLERVKARTLGLMQRLAGQDAGQEDAHPSDHPGRSLDEDDLDGGDEDDEEDDFLDSDLPEDDESTFDTEQQDGSFAGPGVEMREIKSPEPAGPAETETSGKAEDSEDDWKRRMEEPPRFNLRHVKIPDMPVRKRTPGNRKDKKDAPEEVIPKAEKEASEYQEDSAVRSPEDEAEAALTADILASVVPAPDAAAEPEPSAEKEDKGPAAENGIDAPSGPAAESEDTTPAGETSKSDGAAPAGGIPESGKNAPADQDMSLYQDDFDSDADDFRTPGMEIRAEEMKKSSSGDKKEDSGDRKQQRKLSDLLNKVKVRKRTSSFEEMKARQAAEQRSLRQELERMREDLGKEEAAGPQSIEVVNLNENANHKQAVTIDLDKSQTGPLPDLSRTAEDLSSASSEKRRRRKGTHPDLKIGGGKKAIWGILILAGVVLAALLIFMAVRTGIGGSESSLGSGITADEGLTVRIRKQPMEYTRSGQVTLSIRVPNTIQSITVDDQSVEFEGDKKTEITVPVTKSSMKLMVVSTDKVRNATIKLAYVDSEPPVIEVKTTGNVVTLTAKDDGSGVEGIYYGTAGAFSDVPLYQTYTQPFEEDESAVYSWYATDKAGNSTVPVSGSFREASSIAFEKDSYVIYPNSEVTLKVTTDPAGAYLNNLVYTSSDQSVCTIEHGNVLVPVSEGSAEVTASADGLEPVSAQVVVSDAKQVTISAVGDCTLGTDPNLAPENNFTAYQNVYGNEYFMKNVKNILSQDDVTFANLEGTLTTSEQRANKKFTFKGDASCTDILNDGSINVVTLANNHTEDYGDQGLADTKQNLQDGGIDWCDGDDIAYEEVNGVKCAFIGIYAVENGLDSLEQVKRTVAAASDEGAGLIVVYFHWNSELVPEPNDDMVTLGHAAVDAGADLVVGSHSHIVSGIEKYNGRYIVYGLSNFCFGGNLYPNDYDSMIFRQTFTLDGDGIKDDDQIKIIPVRISSQDGVNNYQPTPVSGDAADQIMQKIDERSARFGSSWDEYMSDGTAA